MKHLVTTKTPLRIGLFGGGTDLPEISDKIGGAVLNFTIAQFVYVTVKQHSGLFHEKYRLQYSSTERVDSLELIENDIIRETLKYFDIRQPLIINTLSDMPASSGLGGSSSFTVGLVNALNRLFDLKVSKTSLAETAFTIERSIKGSTVGRQDAYAAAFGGFNLLEFGSKNSITPVTEIASLYALLPNLKLFWTGTQRSASKLLSYQILESNDKLPIYGKLKQLATSAYEEFSNSEPISLERFAKLLGFNRDLKYQLSPSISDGNTALIESEIIKHGAISTKLLGAGGGGFILGVFLNDAIPEISNEKLFPLSFEIELDYYGSQIVLEE